jgi:selenophosphate synthetase-related protein
MGFVLTAKEANVLELIRLFGSVGMVAKAIGTVDTTQELRICYEGDETQVFDFIHNGVMRLFSEDLPCRLH